MCGVFSVGLIRRLFLVMLYWASPALSTTSPPAHTIELRITDHKAGIANFKQLFVSLESVAVHQAGFSRAEGWLELYGKTPFIDIVPLKDGKYTVVDKVDMAATRYDAVRVRFSEMRNELLTGDMAKLTWRNTTVAADIDLEQNKQLAVVIDLYAEDQTEHPSGGYEVKVKEVRIEK